MNRTEDSVSGGFRLFLCCCDANQKTSKETFKEQPDTKCEDFPEVEEDQNQVDVKCETLSLETQELFKADEDLDFEEQILEAAKSIASATAALVKSASAAQRELVAQGKVGSTFTQHAIDEDGQWSQGLISAARMVAAATHSLCEAANAMVQGHASEERLSASAKEVAASTAQLLMACKVKADPGSVAMQRLQGASTAVKRATEALVKAAQQSREEDDQSNLTVNKRMVGGIAQEIQAQAEILRKEKELTDARNKLMQIRRDRYKDKPPEDEDSSSSF